MVALRLYATVFLKNWDVGPFTYETVYLLKTSVTFIVSSCGYRGML